MQTKNWFLTSCLIVILAGCAGIAPVQTPPEKPVIKPPKLPPGKLQRPAGPLPPSTRPTYNLMGYPPAVQEGYIDGCETAKKSQWGVKDMKRYQSDAQYRMGWDDGFFICGSKR